MDHLYAAEAVCRRLFLWLRGCWHDGPYEAASERTFKRVIVLVTSALVVSICGSVARRSRSEAVRGCLPASRLTPSRGQLPCT